MKITVCSSSIEEIDNKYKESAKELLEYLASIDNAELIWGSGETSLMGMSYNIFKEHNRKIHGYTTKRYVDMIKNLSYADIKIVDTTFDLKKNIFYDADVIIYLYGGIGSISELYSHLEEYRSNYNGNKLLIMYDTEGYSEHILEPLKYSIKEKFTKDSIFDYIKVVHSLEDLKTILKGE